MVAGKLSTLCSLSSKKTLLPRRARRVALTRKTLAVVVELKTKRAEGGKQKKAATAAEPVLDHV